MNKPISKIFSSIVLIMGLLVCYNTIEAAQNATQSAEELKRQREILRQLKTEAHKEEIDITVKSVEITNFPEMRLIIEAYNTLGESLDTLYPEQIRIYEKGVELRVEQIEKIPVANNQPWDFVFLVDVTGSMQPQIDGVVNNISQFANNLIERGIDYRLGLILFCDYVRKVNHPTPDVNEFLSWFNGVKAFGGGDEKENALEALLATTNRITYRPEANRIAILITDAPYHQRGERGDGTTNETTESIIEKLNRHNIRVFSITPPKLRNYHYISQQTLGNSYDINYNFSQVLTNFTRQITNLFRVTYRSGERNIPDSIEVGLFDQNNSQFVRKTIPVIELGRKLIIENLLFQTARYELPTNVKELNILADFMINRPAVEVVIEGHADSTGSHEVNDPLSLRRAEAVMNYLISRGVNSQRMKAVGYGKRRPIATNATEFGRSLNRRTEIVITAK